MEQTVDGLKQIHEFDINYIIWILLDAMIKDVEDEKYPYEDHYLGKEEKRKTKARLIWWFYISFFKDVQWWYSNECSSIILVILVFYNLFRDFLWIC